MKLFFGFLFAFFSFAPLCAMADSNGFFALGVDKQFDSTNSFSWQLFDSEVNGTSNSSIGLWSNYGFLFQFGKSFGYSTDFYLEGQYKKIDAEADESEYYDSASFTFKGILLGAKSYLTISDTYFPYFGCGIGFAHVDIEGDTVYGLDNYHYSNINFEDIYILLRVGMNFEIRENIGLDFGYKYIALVKQDDISGDYGSNADYNIGKIAINEFEFPKHSVELVAIFLF